MNPPDPELPAPPDPAGDPPAPAGDFVPPGADAAPLEDESCLPEGLAPAPFEDEFYAPPEDEFYAPPEVQSTVPLDHFYVPQDAESFAPPAVEDFPPVEAGSFAPPESEYAVSALPPELPEPGGWVDLPAEPAEPAYVPPGVPDEQVALRCDGLQRFLGEAEARVHVLRGVSLRLEPGYVHAVVGPSGCGKSSLLYILGLLDRPDAGHLTISGRPVADLPDDDLSQQRNALLGFIFQFHFLLQDFTAQENIMIPMRQLGVLNEAAMRARANHLLDAVGLAEKGHRPSRHLSGGEQQRVAIARALANDPQVILADEPTGNLDTANSTRVFSLLTDLVHRENKALLLVTHNPAIAAACDWVHTMRDGLIVDQQYVGARN